MFDSWCIPLKTSVTSWVEPLRMALNVSVTLWIYAFRFKGSKSASKLPSKVFSFS